MKNTIFIVKIMRYIHANNYQPSEAHWKLARYAAPEDFARYKQLALAKGFRHVASAPLARSSYRAWEALEDTHDLY